MMDIEQQGWQEPEGVEAVSLEAVVARKRALNIRSMCWGIPGFVIQAVGGIPLMMADPGMSRQQPPNEMMLFGALLCMIFGTVMLLTGLFYYTRYLNRHWAWCLLGFVPYGIIGLAFLKDKTPGIDMIRAAQAGAAKKMSKLAIASAVLGLMSIVTCLPSIAGLVCGIMALVAIRRQPAALKGRGWAIVGIITSGLMTIVLLMMVYSTISAAVSGK